MSDQSETVRERLIRLRRELKAAKGQLSQAEAELDEERSDIDVLEREIDRRLGHLLRRLSDLEDTVSTYRERLERLRRSSVYGTDYLPVEEQFRRTWQTPATGSAATGSAAIGSPATGGDPSGPIDEKQLKRIYRQLARRYHPDLASDEADRSYRTEKMAALNEAYAARSLAEIAALHDVRNTDESGQQQTEAQMADVLDKELARVRRRLFQVQNEKENLHNRPTVRLSVDVKLARRQGRDLLGEMSRDLRYRVRELAAERDELKQQIDQLDS
jgi:chromosome segregation ATPase